MLWLHCQNLTLFRRSQVVVASPGEGGCAMAPTSPLSPRDLAVAKWDEDKFSSGPLVLVASAECSRDASPSHALSSHLLTETGNSNELYPLETRGGVLSAGRSLPFSDGRALLHPTNPVRDAALALVSHASQFSRFMATASRYYLR